MYEYRAQVLRAIDGDTLELRVDLGFQIYTTMRVRLYGINAPEMNTPAGPVAKQYAAVWLAGAVDAQGNIMIQTVKNTTGAERWDKYGRWLATVYPLRGGESLNDALIRTGNAVVYLP